MTKKFFVVILSFVFWSPLLQSRPMDEEEQPRSDRRVPCTWPDLMKMIDEKGVDAAFEAIRPPYKGTPLQEAIERGDSDFINTLIATSSNVNEKDNYGGTALYTAILGGKLGVVNTLVAAGAVVNTKTSHGNTPLFCAIGLPPAVPYKLEIVKALLTARANVNATNGDQQSTALHLAREIGNQEVIDALVIAGADVNAKDFLGRTPFQVPKIGETIEGLKNLEKVIRAVAKTGLKEKTSNDLHSTDTTSHPPSQEEAIANDDLEAPYKQGLFYRDHPEQDPGHAHAIEKFTRALELEHTHVKAMHNLAMLYLKLDNSQKAKEWFQKAADLGFEPSQRNLSKTKRTAKTASVPSNNSHRTSTASHRTASSLRDAIVNEDLKSMNELIAKGGNVNEKDANEWPLLFYAVRTGKIGFINTLIKAGADVNLVDNVGATALHFATMGNNSEIVGALITAGADVNARDNFGAIPLHVAVTANSMNAINTLIAAKADMRAKDSQGDTPLKIARIKGNTEVVRIFLAAGAHEQN